MTFRTRLLLAFLAIVLLPTAILALVVRSETTKRMTSQYERRVDALVEIIEEDLAQQGQAIGASLRAVVRSAAADNRFRRAAVDRVRGERAYLLDYASTAAQLVRLSMLQIQDESGRILSSGHFRNEYDRIDADLPRLLEELPSSPGRTALVQARSPEGPFLALVRVDSLTLGNRRYAVVGGVRMGDDFLRRLARGRDLSLTLEYPGGMLHSEGPASLDPSVDGLPGAIVGQQSDSTTSGPASPQRIVRELHIPFLDTEEGAVAEARIRVTRDLSDLAALRRSLDRWFLVTALLTALVAILIAVWLSALMSRPLAELADKTARIDLEQPHVTFRTDRKDEIGSLSRVMSHMTRRLRSSAAAIKDAERRATLGELARQVNHDIKNGLTPIRNVFQHLSELAADDSQDLPKVFREREATIDSGISYLENLAQNYARLSPSRERSPCDVNTIVRRLAEDLRAAGRINVGTRLTDRAVVLGDPLSLRRILENLVDNAAASLEDRTGTVTISTVRAEAANQGKLRITVADTGVGMTADQRDRAFDDFYTTKTGGTGLGLSIVRRLVMDLGGTVTIESEKGTGTRVIVELPEAGV